MSRIALSPRIFFALLLIFALSSCGGGAAATELPSADEPTQELPNSSPPSPTLAATLQPAIPERRRLTLEFPPRMRAGDADIVRLTFEVDTLGNITPTAQIGNVVTGEVIEIPNLYESHHVIAESRLDIAGMEVAPSDLVSQPLEQGKSITFAWSIHPQGTGFYRGTVWLYLRFVDKVSGEESRRTVSAQIIEIEAVNFYGFSANFTRYAGAIGSVVGTIIGFPFLEDIVKFLFGRRRVRRTQS